MFASVRSYLTFATDTINLLEQRHRAIVEPSEQAFVARVRGVENERAQVASHIQEQVEEAAARERDIERMQVCTAGNISVIRKSGNSSGDERTCYSSSLLFSLVGVPFVVSVVASNQRAPSK